MDFVSFLFDNIDEAVIIVDPDGRIVFFNKVAADFNKRISLNNLELNKQLLDIIRPEKRKRVQEILTSLKSTKETTRIFQEYYLQNEVLYFEFDYIPAVNDEGQISHIIIYIRDLTPQKIFEKRITSIANDVKSLIENAHAVIMAIDSRGYITEWNNHTAHLTGFSKNEVYTRKMADVIIHENSKKAFDDLVNNSLKKESLSNNEITIKTKNGDKLILLISATPRVTGTGSVVGITFVGQDITELTSYRKSLEKKVEDRTQELKLALKKEQEITELKSRFVSIASHEFRAPLATINFAAEFIKRQRDQLPGPHVDAQIENIKKNVLHMQALLDDILTIGKTESTKLAVSLSDLDFMSFIEKLAKEVKHLTKNSHEIVIRNNTPSQIIRSDEKFLRNVFINLFTNAIKYSPGKKHVDVEMLEDYDSYTVLVKDYGIGIHSHEIEKIFDSFERASNAREIEGTGLGLSIVKKALEVLEGTIEVESSPGEGSAFKVTLPKKIN